MNFFRTVRGFLPCLLTACIACASLAEAQTNRNRTSPTPNFFYYTATTEIYTLPDVVATVDGEPIKKADLQRVATAMAGSEGKAMKDLTPAQQQQTDASVLESMIVDKLVATAASNDR